MVFNLTNVSITKGYAVKRSVIKSVRWFNLVADRGDNTVQKIMIETLQEASLFQEHKEFNTPSLVDRILTFCHRNSDQLVANNFYISKRHEEEIDLENVLPIDLIDRLKKTRKKCLRCSRVYYGSPPVVKKFVAITKRNEQELEEEIKRGMADGLTKEQCMERRAVRIGFCSLLCANNEREQ